MPQGIFRRMYLAQAISKLLLPFTYQGCNPGYLRGFLLVVDPRCGGVGVQSLAVDELYIPYSRKISRTINFAVFEDFTTASKINSLKSYIESYDSLVDPRNLIHEMFRYR